MELRIRDDAVEWRKLGDEVVILDLRAARYFSLNGTGARLWPLIVEGATPEALAAELAEAFALAGDVAARDVEAFLADLRERDLIAPEA